MNTTLIIILAAVIAGAIFYFLRKVPKASSDNKPYMTVGEAENNVNQLAELGYYKYADTKDIDALKKDLCSSLAEYGVLSTIYNERTFIPHDNRLFLFDGETLFEEGGFMEAIDRMRPLFDKMNFRVDINDHIEEADSFGLNHFVTINGKPYIVFENFDGYGWGEAAQRFAEIINDQLKLQHKAEQLYLINGANDGLSICLTDEQHQLIDRVLTDDYWKPLKVEKWCKVFQVDPTKYRKKL